MARSAEFVIDCEAPLLRPVKERLDKTPEDDGATRGTSFIRTCFNGLNALSGVGLLSVPYAISQGGWVSLTLLLLVAVVCCYTGLLLQRCMDASLGIKSYPDIGELAFGAKGRFVVSTVMYLELYLVAVGFLILEGDCLNKMFPNTSISFWPDLNLTGKRMFIIASALVLIPTTWVRSLGLLAYVSASGLIASVVVLLSVLWSATIDGVGFSKRGQFVNFSGFPSALGLYTFCYCGHAVFPTLCNSMKDKTKFSKVLQSCFLLCTMNYAVMAVIGYMMYGDGIESEITLNLPAGKVGTSVAVFTTLINPFSKYALMITPIADMIEETLPRYKKGSRMLVIRALLLLSMVVVALSVPFFGDLMSLTGSVLSVSACMLLPCACYLKIFVPLGCQKWEVAAILGILVLGFFVATFGMYSSIMQIVERLF